MEKINYLDQYGGNNLTEKPLEYYLEVFEKNRPIQNQPPFRNSI